MRDELHLGLPTSKPAAPTQVHPTQVHPTQVQVQALYRQPQILCGIISFES